MREHGNHVFALVLDLWLFKYWSPTSLALQAFSALTSLPPGGQENFLTLSQHTELPSWSEVVLSFAIAIHLCLIFHTCEPIQSSQWPWEVDTSMVPILQIIYTPGMLMKTMGSGSKKGTMGNLGEE